jgi:hypothetical protein
LIIPLGDLFRVRVRTAKLAVDQGIHGNLLCMVTVAEEKPGVSIEWIILDQPLKMDSRLIPVLHVVRLLGLLTVKRNFFCNGLLLS